MRIFPRIFDPSLSPLKIPPLSVVEEVTEVMPDRVTCRIKIRNTAKRGRGAVSTC